MFYLRCFIRVYVAHFIKLLTKWQPLKSVSKRVREVILRVIGLMVKCQNILDLRKILISLFIVITNETDGYDINTRLATPCESHKKELINFTSTGC